MEEKQGNIRLVSYLCKMVLSLSLKQFIYDHAEDDLNQLLLQASRYPETDVHFAVEQIACRRRIKDKLPSWHKNDDLIFPAKIAAEQCSSEQTALYKQRLVDRSDHLYDLTGGLGIDSYFFSQKVRKVTYIERYQTYAEIARQNFITLGANNIQVITGDAALVINEIPETDVFYIDPARRGESNKRLFALQDCEPDLPALLPSLLKKASKVIAKLSPMADISQTLAILPGTTEVHILSVRNECKELLFIIENTNEEIKPLIYCSNFTAEGKEEKFSFFFPDENKAQDPLAEKIQTYLYEPNASILKAGAFKSITKLGINKLHINSHLYTSENLIENFPGRIFRVEKIYDFNNRLCKTLYKTLPQANITVRNFPLSVAELRKRTKIPEGGDIYLFATTIKSNDKVIIQCKKT